MARSFHTTCLAFLLYVVFVPVSCEVTLREYLHQTHLDDKICTDSSEQMFHQSVRSKVACTHLCSTRSACLGVFYNTVALTCTACSGYSIMAELKGTIFMTKLSNTSIEMKQYGGMKVGMRFSKGSCGPPLPSNHVYVGYLSGRFPYGYQLSYSCTSCIYFSPSGEYVITCQANGTWTTPTCVYGPDVGLLPNGQLIPNGSAGCFSSYQTRCLTYSGNPHVSYGLKLNGQSGNCWCDSACCDAGDCCFDVDC